ncbi:MAG: phosphoribosyl-AMP cyclohydrolase [Hyphomicrobiaceae bacterium]
MSRTGDDIETTDALRPRFDRDGLVPAIATDAQTGLPLMLAYMNDVALRLTLETGIAHFWSRSRGKLWRKGETSGNELKIVELRTDCDQDAVWLRVTVAGDGRACHTGAKTCFYRQIRAESGGSLRLVRVED